MHLRDASPLALAARTVKVGLLGARRLATWMVDPSFAAPERATPTGPIAHRMRIPIARSGADPRLEAGKRHNVRLAAAAFHGVVISPERPLSFWRTLGPTTAARGFEYGMELRSGCAVPAVGGGICLLSNALFAISAELGWTILERHGHSLALSDPHAFDATVAFPHVDLRVAPRSGRAILDVAVRGDVLAIAVHGEPGLRVAFEREQAATDHTRDTRIRRTVWRDVELLEDAVIVDDHQRIPVELRTCLDCGQTACKARVELPVRGVAR